MTYHFPDAFYGQNTKLRETLNNLILKSPQDWPTGVGLPFVRIQGTNVEWDELKFDVRLLQRVPYEGVSRMQTSLRRRHRDRVVRCVAPPLRIRALCRPPPDASLTALHPSCLQPRHWHGELALVDASRPPHPAHPQLTRRPASSYVRR